MSNNLSGRNWKWIHLFLIFGFLGLWAAAWVFKWVESVVFVSHVSMVALVLAEVSAWQAARTEQKQDKHLESNQVQDDRQDSQLGNA
jgi:hypothetical protein